MGIEIALKTSSHPHVYVLMKHSVVCGNSVMSPIRGAKIGSKICWKRKNCVLWYNRHNLKKWASKTIINNKYTAKGTHRGWITFINIVPRTSSVCHWIVRGLLRGLLASDRSWCQNSQSRAFIMDREAIRHESRRRKTAPLLVSIKNVDDIVSLMQSRYGFNLP